MGEVWRHGSNLRLLAAVLAGALGIVFAAPAAMAQSPADQYIPSPKPADAGGNDRNPAAEQTEAASTDPAGNQSAFGPASQPPAGPGGGGKVAPSGPADTAFAGAADSSASAQGGGGSDYPLTPFVVAVLSVLALGLLVSVAHAARQRGGDPA